MRNRRKIVVSVSARTGSGARAKAKARRRGSGNRARRVAEESKRCPMMRKKNREIAEEKGEKRRKTKEINSIVDEDPAVMPCHRQGTETTMETSVGQIGETREITAHVLRKETRDGEGEM